MSESDLKQPRLCPHCGNITSHAILFQCVAPKTSYANDGTLMPQTFYAEDGTPYADAPKTDYVLLQCQTCKDISLYSKFDFEEWEEAGLQYPSGYDLHPCIPEAVSMNYCEAKQVQKVSPNAFAVLLRRALEALCDDRGAAAGPLARRLKELSDRGEIPGKLADISTVLRELGNAGAHHTTQKVTVPLTWTMDEFFRTLLEYVYVAPYMFEQFRKRLKEYDEEEQVAPANPPSPRAQAGG